MNKSKPFIPFLYPMASPCNFFPLLSHVTLSLFKSVFYNDCKASPLTYSLTHSSLASASFSLEWLLSRWLMTSMQPNPLATSLSYLTGPLSWTGLPGAICTSTFFSWLLSGLSFSSIFPSLPSPLPSFLSFVFLGLHLWHMEVPSLRVKREPQPPAYATATALPDQSRVYDQHHSSRQCWILNALSKARDRTLILISIFSLQMLFPSQSLLWLPC